MPFDVPPNRSNEGITASDMRPGTTMSTADSDRPGRDYYATVIRWIPLLLPLIALLLALDTYFIVGEVVRRIQ